MKRAANSPTPVGTSSRAALSVLSPTFGDDATNLVYFPVQPCRIFDSRFGTGVNLGPISGYRNIYVNGGFAAQGGAAAGCSIPTDPAALALNVVAVTPSGAGYIKMYPYTSAEPNASILNFTPGQNLANGLIVSQCQICGLDLTFAVFSASADVVIDVLGYFWSPTPHDGMPATGRGYAKVSGAVIDVNYSRGFSSVTNPSTGVYCLVPTFDWTNVKTPPVLSIDYSSSGNGATAHWRSSGIGCPALQIVVDTFDAAGTFSNEGFQILVP